jgi:hypothetical protein
MNRAASRVDIPLCLGLGFQDEISNRESYFENLEKLFSFRPNLLILFRDVIALHSKETSKQTYSISNIRSF